MTFGRSSRDFELGNPDVLVHNHVEYVSVKEAARRLGVSARSIQRLNLRRHYPLGAPARGVPIYLKLADVLAATKKKVER